MLIGHIAGVCWNAEEWSSERALRNAKNTESKRSGGGARRRSAPLHSCFFLAPTCAFASFSLPFSYRLRRREGALLHLGARGLFFVERERG
jgi:hypothetical protein